MAEKLGKFWKSVARRKAMVVVFSLIEVPLVFREFAFQACLDIASRVACPTEALDLRISLVADWAVKARGFDEFLPLVCGKMHDLGSRWERPLPDYEPVLTTAPGA